MDRTRTVRRHGQNNEVCRITSGYVVWSLWKLPVHSQSPGAGATVKSVYKARQCSFVRVWCTSACDFTNYVFRRHGKSRVSTEIERSLKGLEGFSSRACIEIIVGKTLGKYPCEVCSSPHGTVQIYFRRACIKIHV